MNQAPKPSHLRAPRKRVNFKPPEDWVLAKAVMVKKEHEPFGTYFVQTEVRGVKKVWDIGLKQAWNSNLYPGLEVYVTIKRGVCTIMRRAQQNKQFVKIT